MDSQKDKESCKHLYFSYPRLIERHDECFELWLTYKPSRAKGKRPQVQKDNSVSQNQLDPRTDSQHDVSSEAIAQSKVIDPVQLPLPFKLVMAKLIELLLTEEYGEITVETFKGKKKARYTNRLTIRIKAGTSHQVTVTPEEKASLDEWCATVVKALL